MAGELFYKLMKRILTCEETGMKCCMHDMCVFTLFDDEINERVITLLWVDDIIITGNTLSIVERIIGCIESNVKKISKMGEITRYIGVDLKKDITNTKSVIEKFGPNLHVIRFTMGGCRPPTPAFAIII